MSRFEVQGRLVLKDTQTGEVVEIVNDTYHMNDDKLLGEATILDTFVKDVQKAIDADTVRGAVYNYTSFVKFVDNFHYVMEEVTTPPVQTLEEVFGEYEAGLDEIAASLRPSVDDWTKAFAEVEPPKYLN